MVFSRIPLRMGHWTESFSCSPAVGWKLPGGRVWRLPYNMAARFIRASKWEERSSVQFSLSVTSGSLWPHGLRHVRPPCPSPTPRERAKEKSQSLTTCPWKKYPISFTRFSPHSRRSHHLRSCLPHKKLKNDKSGTSLVVQWLRLHLPLKGVWVQHLVRKLRSHMPCSQKATT